MPLTHRLSLSLLMVLWSAALAVPAPSGPAEDPPLLINEVDVDQAGVDGDEFVELWGAPGAALNGVFLVHYNGSDPGDAAYRVVDLSGSFIPADGLFVVGSASVPEVDLVAWNGNALQNGPDGLALYSAGSATERDFLGTPAAAPPRGAVRFDALVYGTSDPPDVELLAALAPAVGPLDEDLGGMAASHSLQRMPDGDAAGTFFAQTPSPGAPNGAPVAATIHDIQGAAHSSPLAGVRVLDILGVVTSVGGDGFSMQSPARLADASVATSEGLFVLTAGEPAVERGQTVLVSGTVLERERGAATVTSLAAAEVRPARRGEALPPVTRVGAGGRLPPTEVIDDDGARSFDAESDGLDFYESLEGMLVEVPGARVVGPPGFDGWLPVVGQGGRTATGLSLRGVLVASPGDDNPERLFLDVGYGTSLGRGVGDRLTTPAVGVLDYASERYVVRVEGPVDLESGPLAPGAVSLGGAGRLGVASFNVRNLSPTSSPGTFAALGEHIAVALDSPDLLALQEIQDDSGPARDGTVSAEQTYELLTEAVSNAGGPDYDLLEIAPEDGQDGGQPGGNIRVALAVASGSPVIPVFRPGGSARVGTAVAVDDEGPYLTHSPGRLQPSHRAFLHSRKPLAVELRDERGRLFVVVVHFVSKGADDPPFGASQPPVLSSSTKRTEQARIVADFVGELLAADAMARVIVLGDFNAGGGAPAMEVLTAASLADLVDTLPPTERYTHIYQGQGAALDHVLVSPALRPGARCAVAHVNAEFSGAASDHDPVAADLAWP